MDNFDPWQRKFTPGPWRIDSQNPRLVVAPGRPIVRRGDDLPHSFIVVQMGSYSYLVDTSVEVRANTHLISAAPDLLAVCEMVIAEAHLGDAVIKSYLFGLAQNAVNKAYGYQAQPMWSAEWQGG